MKVTGAVVSFSTLYATHFIFLGLLLPFFSGWLALRGFSPSDIGLINGIALVARLAIGSMVAVLVDRQRDKRRPLIFVSTLFAVGGLLLIAFDNNFLIATASILVIWCFGLLVPLTDTMVLRADRDGDLEYGPVRAIGSIAFLLTTLLGGVIFDRLGIEAVGAGLAASSVAALVMAFLLPASIKVEGESKPSRGTLRWQDAVVLVSTPVFLLALFAAGLTQGAHAVYYAYSILHWSDLEYSNATIGWLWATGVLAEIFLLTKARGLARWFSPAWLFGFGALAASIRWFGTALEPSLPFLFFLQMMHALTFAATYLGTIEFIDRAIPVRFVNTGMVLFSTTGVGALTGLATVISGYIYEVGGAGAAYMMMAVMGGIAFVFSMVLHRIWNGSKIIN